MPRVDRCKAPAAPGQETADGRCGLPLVDNAGKRKPAGTKCCGQNCRRRLLAETRRLKRERAAQSAKNLELPEHLQPVADAVANRVKDAAHDVLKEEIRPVVRDAMTEEVLKGLGELVNLVPEAIEALGKDIRQDSEDESFDADRRQRAYTLLLKYTAGNATIAPPPQEQAASPMQVIFAMPRPGDTDLKPPAEVEPEEIVELRDCVECEATKPVADFIGASQRCSTCQGELEKLIADRFS